MPPWPRFPTGAADGDGLIFESVRCLDGDADFVAAVDAADASTIDDRRPARCRGREVVAIGAHDPIVYVHTLTPTAAIRQVADLVDPPVVDLVLGCAWRTVAALVSTYHHPRVEPEPATSPTSTPTT